MALLAGSVTVNSDLSHTGSGLALALYETVLKQNWYVDKGLADLSHSQDARKEVLEAHAELAKDLAVAIIDHITTNAEVTVTVSTSDAGLQLDPASSDPTLAPDSPVIFSTKGTIA